MTLQAQYYIDRTRLVKNELRNLKLEIRKREEDKMYVEYLEGILDAATRCLDIITND
jgi:hypothetical protein